MYGETDWRLVVISVIYSAMHIDKGSTLARILPSSDHVTNRP